MPDVMPTNVRKGKIKKISFPLNSDMTFAADCVNEIFTSSHPDYER